MEERREEAIGIPDSSTEKQLISNSALTQWSSTHTNACLSTVNSEGSRILKPPLDQAGRIRHASGTTRNPFKSPTNNLSALVLQIQSSQQCFEMFNYYIQTNRFLRGTFLLHDFVTISSSYLTFLFCLLIMIGGGMIWGALDKICFLMRLFKMLNHSQYSRKKGGKEQNKLQAQGKDFLLTKRE